MALIDFRLFDYRLNRIEEMKICHLNKLFSKSCHGLLTDVHVNFKRIMTSRLTWKTEFEGSWSLVLSLLWLTDEKVT